MRSAMILGLIDDIGDAITGMIGNFLFGLLGGIFFRFIDWVQGLFRALAGLGPIQIDNQLVNDTPGETQDLVWWLIQTDVVQDVFWSLVTFSLILMFMMTGLAIIRNSYQDKPKPIGEILGNVFKGLIGMIIVPIACMVGLMFGNIILYAIDRGTSASGATSLSGTLFISAAYDANIARDPWDDDSRGLFTGLTTREERYTAFLANSNFEDYLKKNGGDKYTTLDTNWTEEDWNKIADYIDNAYVTGQLKDAIGLPITLYWAGNVSYAYRTWNINYLVLVVGGCLMLGFLFKMCFGMVGRLFKLTIDFVMIPVVMAMMPFDQKPVGSWKSDFIKNTTLAYTTVGVMNIYFSILPIVNKIELVGNQGFLTIVLKLILTIVGLFSAESIISSVGGWFGTGDLLSEGKNTLSTYQSGLKKVTEPVKKAAATTGKFIGAGMAAKKDGGSFFKGAFGNTVGTWAANKANESSILKGLKEGSKSYKTTKEAGGVFASLHSEDKQEQIKKDLAVTKSMTDINKAATSLGLTGDDRNDFILSKVAEEAKGVEGLDKKYNDIALAERNIEKTEKKIGALSSYTKATEAENKARTEVSTLLTSAGVAIDPGAIKTFLETGNFSNVAKMLSGITDADTKEIVKEALSRAKQQYDMANEYSFNALQTFMKQNKYTQVTSAGVTYTLEQLKNLDHEKLRNIIKDGKAKYEGDNGAKVTTALQAAAKKELTGLESTLNAEQFKLEADKKEADKLTVFAYRYKLEPKVVEKELASDPKFLAEVKKIAENIVKGKKI